MSVPSRRWGNHHPKSLPAAAGETNNSNVSLQSRQNALNVKSYLGLQEAISCSLDTCPEGETLPFSTSPMGLISSSTSCTPFSAGISIGRGSICTVTITGTSTGIDRSSELHSNLGNTIDNSCVFGPFDSTRNSNRTTDKPTILQDLPLDLTQVAQTMQHHQIELRKQKPPSTLASRRNHQAISSAAEFRQEAFTKDFSDQVAIDADLDDIDSSYMMSIYMNEESSIYTKGTASTATASTSSSSLASKRSRHRGASQKRREQQAEGEQPRKESGFVRSMKQSSSSFFVEGNWSEKYGWYISKKWDATPGESWDQPDPIFDKEEERLFDNKQVKEMDNVVSSS